MNHHRGLATHQQHSSWEWGELPCTAGHTFGVSNATAAKLMGVGELPCTAWHTFGARRRRRRCTPILPTVQPHAVPISGQGPVPRSNAVECRLCLDDLIDEVLVHVLLHQGVDLRGLHTTPRTVHAWCSLMLSGFLWQAKDRTISKHQSRQHHGLVKQHRYSSTRIHAHLL